MPTDSPVQRIRRAEIAKQLGELRSVIKDLETHGPGIDVSIASRQEHADNLTQAKRKLHDLDLEYIKLS